MHAARLLIAGLLSLTQSQPPAVDGALVERVLAASTDEARTALVAAQPELATEPVRAAIVKAANQRFEAGDITSALNAQRTLLHLFTVTGNVRARINALNTIGTMAGRTGDFALAESALVEGRDAADAAGHTDHLITALNNLGIVLRMQGRYDEAIASYERNLKLVEAAGRRDSVSRTLNNLGIIAQTQGDYRAALDYLNRSLAIKLELGLKDEIANAILNIGVIHHSQRNFTLALDYYERARAHSEQIGAMRDVGSALSNIGNVYIIQGRFAEANAALRKALPLVESRGDRVRTATILHNLGMAARAEHRWKDAEEAFERSLQMQQAMGDRNGEAENLVSLAVLFQAQGQHERALGFAERAVTAARSLAVAPSLWGGLSSAGLSYAALGRPDDAVRAFEESIAVIEQMRRQVAGGAQDLRRFFEDKSEPYFELAAVHAAAGRHAAAFSAVERARARVLIEIIDGGKPIVRTLTDAERAREVQLDRELGVLNARRAAVAAQKPPQADELRQIDDELTRVRRAKDDWQFNTYTAHPDLGFSRGEAPIVSLADAAAIVTPDTAVAIFMTTMNRTWLMLLTRGESPTQPAVAVYPIRMSREELARRTDGFPAQLARRDLSFAPAARELYTLLLGPAERELARTRRLVIVPDSTLWAVPFQALMTPRGRYVIEERAVSYAPSVSALHGLYARRQSRDARAVRLVALGDPDRNGAEADRLPEAAREVKSIASMYGAGSVALVGREATEDRLRTVAPAAGVLHIATHGELVGGSPMYSYVSLAGAGNAQDPAQDGRVEAWEIANMNLQANLAVLSACETALGENGGGEGVVGLSWSLFAAGASTAAVSLWRVDSSSTTELMLAFHKALLANRARRSPAAAMQSAARSLIASSRFRHPFYWAGFVVIGAP